MVPVVSSSPTGPSASSLTSGTVNLFRSSNQCFSNLNKMEQSQQRLCFSLTGVSPFAGENDRATALNIRNYNVAFEESMFSDLCREARGFVIKLLVVDRL